MSVEQLVREVIAQTLSLKPQDINLNGKLSEECEMDSTECVDLRVALEKKFGIKIGPKEIVKQNTPQEIIGVIQSKQTCCH